MAQTENRVLSMYKKLEKLPLGNALFAQALCMQHPDFREAYDAWVEKRAPRFERD